MRTINVSVDRASNGNKFDIPNDYTASYRNASGEMVEIVAQDISRTRRGEYVVTLDIADEQEIEILITNGDEGGLMAALPVPGGICSMHILIT